MAECPGSFEDLTQAVDATPWLEFVAVILAIAYLALAVRQRRACFVAAFLSTAIYVGLAYDVDLPMHSALNVFYMLMAIYGWYTWGRDDTGRPVSVWPLQLHAVAVLLIAAGAWLATDWFAMNSRPALSWLDAATTLGAMWATLLLARKEWTHWLYWLAIDAALVYVFIESCLWLTAALYVIYLGMIPFGLIGWWRDWRAGREIPTRL